MKICVFCSSRKELSPSTFEQAKDFCKGLVDREMELVYGGGLEGLMGFMADAVLAEGGKVYGVFPDGIFPNEVAHDNLTQLIMTEDMMERKRKMMEMSDAFVVFPGGIGTLDEALEVMTWKSIGCFKKPILFFNWEGFWDSFHELLKDYESRGVFHPKTLDTFEFVNTVEDLFTRLQ